MRTETIASIEIVTACFAINFLYGGAGRLGSVFFAESIHHFEISRTQASFPFVLIYMVRNFIGPVLGYLAQIFGMKFLINLGNILAVISIGACFFAENILGITLLWGAVFGACHGLGTQYLPLFINAHFTESRSGANGLAYAGNCLGGVLLPPIMSYCIENYGLKGTFLILAGIMTHLIPFTLLLKSTDKKSETKTDNQKDNGICNEIAIEDDETNTSAFNLDDSSHANDAKTKAPNSTAIELNLKTIHPTESKEGDETNPSALNLGDSSQANNTKTKEQNSTAIELNLKTIHPTVTKEGDVTNPSALNLGDSSQANNTKTKAQNSTAIELMNLKTNPKVWQPTKPKNQKSNKDIKKKPSIFTLQNFKIFIDPSFLIIFIMTGGNTLVVGTMWTIILDFVRDKGVGANLEIYYVMIMAITDILGRAGSGFVIDKKFLPTSVLTSICCVCAGLSLLGLLFVKNYLLLMFVEFLYPLFYGTLAILQIALIHEFIQPEKRVMAMVNRTLLYTPLSLTTAPMIGYFREVHGSYDGVVYIQAGISFFCGLIIYFVPYVEKREKTVASNAS